MIYEYKQVDTYPNIQHVVHNNQLIGIGTSTKMFFGSLRIDGVKYEIVAEDGQIIVKENGNAVGKIKQKIQKLNLILSRLKRVRFYRYCHPHLSVIGMGSL